MVDPFLTGARNFSLHIIKIGSGADQSLVWWVPNDLFPAVK
jgi:hypothetical protein